MAAIGFYGLLSFHVTRRTGEIGVRMAVGATRGQVHGLFLRQTHDHSLRGFVPGIVLTEMVGRTARTLLYGIQETDPWASGLAVFAFSALSGSCWLTAHTGPAGWPLGSMSRRCVLSDGTHFTAARFRRSHLRFMRLQFIQGAWPVRFQEPRKAAIRQ